MTAEEEAISKYIIRLQKKLSEPDLPENKILKYLHNLNKLPVTVQILKVTGIGKTLGELKKREDTAGIKALELVTKWKGKFCAKNQKSDGKDDGHSNTDKDLKPRHNNAAISHAGKDIKHKNLTENRKEKDVSSFSNTPDHWKDVSLNLLGDNSKKVKKKRKLIKPSPEKQKQDQELEETHKKKHVIAVRRDPTMPSLPDIQLPDIQRVYRPLRFSADSDADNSFQKKKKANVTEVDFGANIVSRNSRTMVFSGRKSAAAVPSLYQQCMKILIENIDALEDTGGVPYEILEPLLIRASPAQLVRLEEFNPYFTEDTGELWKFNCQREFKGQEPDDMESWREMYLRQCKERKEKLRNIQSKITEKQAQKDPIRQVKLAYVAGPPKPSAQVKRKQNRYGTGKDEKTAEERSSQLKTEMRNRHREEAAHTVAFTKIPKRDRCSAEALQPRPKPKPEIFSKKPASKPMMKAALKMMKSQRNRGTVKIIRK